MIVLAVVEEGRPLPPGVTVLAHVRATGTVTGRHVVDLGNAAAQDRRMALLTLTETADELRLSPRQVERLVRDGKLPSVVIGAARRVEREALLEFIARHRQPAGANGG